MGDVLHRVVITNFTIQWLQTPMARKKKHTLHGKKCIQCKYQYLWYFNICYGRLTYLTKNAKQMPFSICNTWPWQLAVTCRHASLHFTGVQLAQSETQSSTESWRKGGWFKVAQLGGGFIFLFTPTWGNDPIWLIFFSNGLKPPTSPFVSSFILTLPETAKSTWIHGWLLEDDPASFLLEAKNAYFQGAVNWWVFQGVHHPMKNLLSVICLDPYLGPKFLGINFGVRRFGSTKSGNQSSYRPDQVYCSPMQ